MNKPFTETAFKKYDQKARRALLGSEPLKDFLRKQFDIEFISPNPDKYGVDFLGHDIFEEFERGIEVETKNAAQFRDGKFGFATVHFAGRKFPLFEAGDLLVQFDGRYEHAVVVDPKEARFYIESKTTNRNAGEEDFVAVPTTDVFIVKVKPEATGPDITLPAVVEEISLDAL
jgi:hypothetical protein